MAETNISWTDYTYNPWIGCTKVSEGCANCYAITDIGTVMNNVKWGPAKPRRRKVESTRDEPLVWDRKARKEGRRIRVFSGSLCDVFDDDPTQLADLDAWRDDLFSLISRTTNTDWQLLTKRPQIALRYAETIRRLPQVWVGTSCENQKRADERLPILAKIPASVRFVSAEPLVGPINFGSHIQMLDWVIVGGESGPKAKIRKMELPWAEAIQRECSVARVPYFFKQVGGSDDKKGGHLIGGRVHQEFPIPTVRRVVPFSAPTFTSNLNPNVVAQNCSGQLIREHREAAGFTQSRLAKSIGLGRDAVAKIESGARCVTDWELLEFARALQTSPNSLLGLGRHAD